MKTAFILKAVMHNIRHRSGAVLISVLAIAVAFTFLSAVGNITFGLASTAVNSSLSYPLVVGPEGSSDTQLVMSTIFNIDKPSGTLDYKIYEKLKADPRVVSAFPIARADSYMGIPITGVNSDFINGINKGFVSKRDDVSPVDPLSEKDLYRAIIGFKVAEKYELKIGDEFAGSHGHVGDEGASGHDNFEYKVAAIMNPVNGPEDFSIYVNYKAVWEVHGQGEKHDHDTEIESHKGCANYELHHGEHEAEHDDHKTLSAVLVKTVNPVATAELEREYSSGTGSTATDVGRTVRRIVQYMNKAETAAGFFSYGTLMIVLAMVFVTILMSINERKKEMALMRTLGIGRMSISMTVMIETIIVATVGILTGIIAGHGVLWYLKPLIDFNLGINLEPFIFTKVELQGIIITLVSGQVLALIAMLRIYNMNLIEEVSRD